MKHSGLSTNRVVILLSVCSEIRVDEQEEETKGDDEPFHTRPRSELQMTLTHFL